MADRPTTVGESMIPEAFDSAAVLRNVYDAVVSTDEAGIVQSWNAGAARVYGYKETEALGKHISFLYFEEDRGQLQSEVLAPAEARGFHETEVRNCHKDGREIFVALRLSCVRESGGGRIAFFGCSNDITERRKVEIARRREVEHRAKNLIARIHAMVDQTIDSARSPDQFGVAVRGRLGALVQMSTSLAASEDGGMDLVELVELSVMVPSNRRESISLTGGTTRVPADVGRCLWMALHELSTNAVQHGALSAPDGRVSIEWKLEDVADARRLQLQWRELGGPAVLPPQQRGFGSELIEEAIPYELGGRARLAFEPTGVACEFTLPFSSPGRIG